MVPTVLMRNTLLDHLGMYMHKETVITVSGGAVHGQPQKGPEYLLLH